MRLLIINSAEPTERSFVDPLVHAIGKMEPKTGLQPEVHGWQAFSGASDIGSCSAVIISASPMGDNENFAERVQAMKHNQLPIYGVQWHAEISTPRIIRNLLEMCC